MTRNLQCLKTLSFAILFLLLFHVVIGEKKDGTGRNNSKQKGGGPPKTTCANPPLVNGEVNKTADGFRFSCKSNFKMLGQKTSKCVNGSLNHAPPVCTAPGCGSIGRLNKMVDMIEPKGYKGRVIEFSCPSGYTLKGLSLIHCNGERWSRGQPQCIENAVSTSLTPPMKEEKVVSTTSSITTGHKDEIKSPTAFSITLRPPPKERPTIFRSKWTTIHSVQSSAVHFTPALSTGAQDSFATTTDFGDITSSISTENKAPKSSAVTTASHESEKVPTTPEMPEDTETETLKDDSLSSFDQSTSKVTTQIDDTGVGRSEISGKSDENPELTTQAAITEIDETEPTTGEFPSSLADDFFPSYDILVHTDAGPTDEEEPRKATSPKIDDRMTEVEQAKSEPPNFIADTETYPKKDKKTPEPLQSTAEDDDKGTRHATIEEGIIKSSTIRSIFQTGSKRYRELEGYKNENTDYQVTVALIVLAVVAACVLLALIGYVVVIKVNAFRSQDPTQNEHAAVAYAEKEINGPSAVNDSNVKSHCTQL